MKVSVTFDVPDDTNFVNDWFMEMKTHYNLINKNFLEFDPKKTVTVLHYSILETRTSQSGLTLDDLRNGHTLE
jgi:hypothetical protein